MRFPRLLVCVAAIACSSSAGGPPQTAPETVRIQGGSGAMTVSTVPTVAENGGTVAYPVDRVWGVLRTVYDSVGIAPTTLDPNGRVIGNPGLKLRRRLGNVALSKIINCGSTQGGPSADSYEIIMSVLTQARTDGAGTSVKTTVEAQGRPITLSGEYVRCSSLGTLETRIVDLVKAQLKR